MNFSKLVILLCTFSLLTACAGRAAHPVAINQYGDQGKSCSALNLEISMIENNVQQLIPQTDKTGRNVAFGVAGLFVWPLWLFMDLSTAEKQELHALRARHDHLINIAQQKQCTMSRAA